MFSSSIVAASGVTSGYSANLEVGSATDKFGTRYGFNADPNTTPPWGQQGTGSSTVTKYGNLDTVLVSLGGTDYQITGVRKFAADQSFSLLHPDQTDTSALPADLFTSISTDLGTLNAADATNRTFNYQGNSNYTVTTYFWSTSGSTVFTDIIGTTATTRTLTITE